MDEDRTTLARAAETYSAHGSAVDGIDEFRALTADATDLVIESYGVELVPRTTSGPGGSATAATRTWR